MSEFDFHLPDVGEGLAEAEIVRWLVPEGGQVVRMEPMVEIETAKSIVEIPSPVDGTLVRHGAPEGKTLDVGAVLAVLSSTKAVEPAAPESPAGSSPQVEESAGAVTAISTTGRRRVPAAPTVRKLAVQLGIDLAEVTGSGPAGRVLASDVDAAADAAANPQVAPTAVRAPRGDASADRTEKLSGMRAAIMDRLAAAWSQVPLITDMRDADAAGLVQARKSLIDEMEGEKVTFTTLFAAVALAALRRHPSFNASLDPAAGTVTYHGAVDLGIAVSVPGGLSVGVVRDAGSLSLREFGQEINDVAEEARAGQLSVDRSRGATFTISSFGQFGGWYGTPLVVPPQVAIAGFGPIKDKVVPVDGVPAVRPTLAMSVSADHRLIDGAELSTFCSTIERMIAEPIRILGG